ncbi:MAG: hypothetical protein R3F62_25280 [Planctomycetota bacterium]
MKLRTIGALAIALGIVGCKGGTASSSSNTTTAPTTSGMTSSPTSGTTGPTLSTAAPPAFAVYYTAAPAVVGEAVVAIAPLAGGDLILGQSGGGLNRVDQNGVAVLEAAVGTVGGIVDNQGTLFAAGEQGQVQERSGTTWSVAFTHNTLPQTVVATQGGDVYAFNSLLGTDPVTGQVLPAQVSQSAAGGAWVADVAALGNVQITAAAAWNTSVWAGGSDNSIQTGGPRLFHGSGAVWNEVTLPNTANQTELEVVTDIMTTPTKLWVSTMVIDTLTTPAVAVGGNVYETTDGATFTPVASFNGDAPICMAWHESTLFVGTLAGRLFHEEPTNLVEETALPANLGVFALESLDAQTLLIGLRGNAGAELVTRSTTPVQNTPPPAPSTTYVGDVRPVLMSRCAVCHSTATNPAFVSYPLSTGLTDTTADYNETRARVNLTTPDASSLLRKAVGLDNHGGGASITQGSADYTTLQQWVIDQAPLQ